MEQEIKPRKWGWLILFTSAGTLLCCALPILFVILGMGSVVASIASNVPFLITLSMHKAWVFGISGLLLLISGWLLYRPGRYCPSDPLLAELCENSHRWNVRMLWVSAVIWAIGFFFAFVAQYIFF